MDRPEILRHPERIFLPPILSEYRRTLSFMNKENRKLFLKTFFKVSRQLFIIFFITTLLFISFLSMFFLFVLTPLQTLVFLFLSCVSFSLINSISRKNLDSLMQLLIESETTPDYTRKK